MAFEPIKASRKANSVTMHFHGTRFVFGCPALNRPPAEAGDSRRLSSRCVILFQLSFYTEAKGSIAGAYPGKVSVRRGAFAVCTILFISRSAEQNNSAPDW